jgi:phosphoenolpyruvate-protein kinase (PTS system EI component)
MSEIEGVPAETAETAAPAAPESRLTRLLKRALRWVVAALVVFVLGVAATWFSQVRPRAAEVARLQEALAAAETELEALRPLEAENQALGEQNTLLRQQVYLVEALVDVTSARVALLLGEPEAARAALAGTDERLYLLTQVLDETTAAQVQPMRDRLAQALQELDGDLFAARSDLEVLANALANLLRALPAQ